jgi:glycosyltransferase involved in cell wall biosynthesis
MKVSIITPSYNQVQFIERTINSVLDQDYRNVEYIIIDGGSEDGTLDILRKYSDRILWISEKDNGQTEAINKGIKMASGEVIAFLNSDDTYEPGAIRRVVDYFICNEKVMWLTGKCKVINEKDVEIRKLITLYKNLLLKKHSYAKLLAENYISQPATFWKKELHAEFGLFDESEHYCMDYEFWLRIGRRYALGYIDDYLANFRYYDTSKSGGVNKQQFLDDLRIAQQYGKDYPLSLLMHKMNYYKIMMIYRVLKKIGQ